MMFSFAIACKPMAAKPEASDLLSPMGIVTVRAEDIAHQFGIAHAFGQNCSAALPCHRVEERDPFCPDAIGGNTG
jgi:hypothetical protein